MPISMSSAAALPFGRQTTTPSGTMDPGSGLLKRWTALAPFTLADEVLTAVSVQAPRLSLNPFGQRAAHRSINSESSTLMRIDDT